MRASLPRMLVSRLTLVEHMAGLSSVRARRAQVLSTVHLQAERVYPPKPTSKLVHDAHRRHNYDHEVDYEDVVTQRYYSLTVAWERLLHHIAHDVDMDDDDFAFIFEDDIALHEDLAPENATEAILHGMELARADGLLYLGACDFDCAPWRGADHWVGGVRFEKCASHCTHAMAITKGKAATLMQELHVSVLTELYVHGDGVRKAAFIIDQQLKMYSQHHNGTWTVGTNFFSPQDEWRMFAFGAFYQDKLTAHSTILTRRRSLRTLLAWG